MTRRLGVGEAARRGLLGNGEYGFAVSISRQAWAEVLARVVDDAHLVTGDQLSIMLDRAVRQVGLTAEEYFDRVDRSVQENQPLAFIVNAILPLGEVEQIPAFIDSVLDEFETLKWTH